MGFLSDCTVYINDHHYLFYDSTQMIHLSEFLAALWPKISLTYSLLLSNKLEVFGLDYPHNLASYIYAFMANKKAHIHQSIR